jgi:GNAT superfamily N-acetyltransferase
LCSIDEISEAEPLFHEYVEWGREHLAADYGIIWDDGKVAAMHDGFRAEWPKLVSERGRLYLARHGDEVTGVGGLKPMSDDVAEVKRVFVRPAHRGMGIARLIMGRLLEDARDLGYRTVRLDTMAFMSDAHHLYRSLGFVDTEPYTGEGAEIGLGVYLMYMELDMGRRS